MCSLYAVNAIADDNLHGDGVFHKIGFREEFLPAVLGRGDDNSDLSTALDEFLADTNWVRTLICWFGTNSDPKQQKAMLVYDIATIDTLLGDQIDAIMHHSDFKRLEASWRGVHLVVNEIGEDDKIRIRLFNASWRELARDFNRAVEFDQSTLYVKIYDEEYDIPGGVPYGLLLCDYEVQHRLSPTSRTATDVDVLSSIAQVASAAFSPCVLGATPELFGISSFSDLSYVQRLNAGFQLTEYHRWKKLREQEESRFLGLILPRILLRDLYRDHAIREDGFRYQEDGSSLDSWLWGNAIFAFGVVAIQSFREWGWFADICGTDSRHGESEELAFLPTPHFSTKEAVAYRRPLEVELTDKKQKILEDLGFISLSPCHFTKSVVFLGTPSIHLSSTDRESAEQENARLSSVFRYVMCVSRFAHYVKVIVRDRVGTYTSPRDLERYLDNWLREYTIGNSDASLELKAKHPLSNAQCQIKEIHGRTDIMSCIIHLQPHFQFDQVISNFQLRIEIPSVKL